MWSRMESDGNALKFTDGRYKLRLCAYAQGIMRVTQTGHDEFVLRDDPMVVAKANGMLELNEVEDIISVDCGKLSCRLNCKSGALTWYGNGEEIMREPAKDGRVLRETDIIKQKFGSDSRITEYQSVDGIRARVEGTPYVDRHGYQTKLSFVFYDDEDIYGLGQHEEGVLNYRGSHQFLYQHNLKISCPVIVSSRGWGVLNNCCGAQIFHDDAFGSYISADAADEMDYFVIYGPELDGIVGGIRLLTGDAPLLPRWTLGYVQSKEHYATAQELIDTVAEFRRRGIPLDCIVQDWQTWSEGQWGQKTTDKSRYPDLKATIDKLHEMNAKLMWSIWPTMNGDCPNQLEFQRKGQMLGNQRTFDAFNPDARATYWGQCMEELFPSGMDAWWCDCSEPFEADWYGEVVMLPEDRMRMNVDEAKHYIDPTQILAYSINHSRGMYEGQRSQTSERRVVNLTRSGLTGQQRYSTICWNGDTSATWEVLRRTVPDGLNLMVTGLPYWTVDAGGFFVKSWPQWFGRGEYELGCEDDNYRELYVRWLQLSTFLPMMRSHGADTPREVWRFGEKGEKYYDAILDCIRLRYMLLPYTYSEMAAIHFKRSTMMRMLAFDFRQDPIARNIPDQFMFGHALMICPILTPASEDGVTIRDVYLPDGADWYDFWSNERYSGGQWLRVQAALNSIPIFVRAGSIIPIGVDAECTGKAAAEPATLYVYPGANGAFTLYNDAGDGYGYEHGEYATIAYTWNEAEHKLDIVKNGDERFMPILPEVKVIE